MRSKYELGQSYRHQVDVSSVGVWIETGDKNGRKAEHIYTLAVRADLKNVGGQKNGRETKVHSCQIMFFFVTRRVNGNLLLARACT